MFDEYCVDCIFSCTKVAQSYLNLGEYKKAIQYYDSSLNKYKSKYLMCGMGAMLEKSWRDKDLFFAYEGLKDYEKALEIATPYFFDSTFVELIDTSFSAKYFKTLDKLYPYKEAKVKIDKAIDSLSLKITTIYKISKDSLPTNNLTTLFSSKLDLLEDYSEKGLLKYFSEIEIRENIVSRIKSSIGYRRYNPMK